MSTSSSSAPGSPASAPRTTCATSSPTGPSSSWTPRTTGAAPGGPTATRACAPTATCSPTATGSSPGAARRSRRARRSSPTSTRSSTSTAWTQYIRYQHRVTAASWSTEDRRWTVEVTRGDTGQRLRFTTDFLWMCQGYYNHAKPYRPEWHGMDRFQGLVVHPQRWPEDLDLAGKRVVVIGSGATAATLIPAIARERRARDDAAALPDLLLRPAHDPRARRAAARRSTSPTSGRTRSCAAQYIVAVRTSWPGRRSRRPTSCTRSSSSRCARCCPRASTSRSTSPPATARGSSASPSSRTATCSRRCARARPRSSPTPSRRSPSTGSRSARARRSRPTSSSPPPASTCRSSATSRSPSTASRSTSPSASPGAAS